MKWRPYSARTLLGAAGYLAAGGFFFVGGLAGDDTWLMLCLPFFVAMAALNVWQAFSDKYERTLMPERQYVVALTNNVLRIAEPDREAQIISVEDLVSVSVWTTDSGPGAEFKSLDRSATWKKSSLIRATQQLDVICDRLRAGADHLSDGTDRSVALHARRLEVLDVHCCAPSLQASWRTNLIESCGRVTTVSFSSEA